MQACLGDLQHTDYLEKEQEEGGEWEGVVGLDRKNKGETEEGLEEKEEREGEGSGGKAEIGRCPREERRSHPLSLFLIHITVIEQRWCGDDHHLASPIETNLG
jgi:hypothetical protein